MRAEEPLDDEPADPADGSRDLVGLGQKRALAVRLDLVRPDQRPGESSVVIRQAWKVATHRGSAIGNACAECSASGSACATPTCCGSTAAGNVAVAADVPRSARSLIWNITRRSPRTWLRSLSSTGCGPRCLVRTPRYSPSLISQVNSPNFQPAEHPPGEPTRSRYPHGGTNEDRCASP